MKLNKEKIAKLSDNQAKSIFGGKTRDSTNHNFTCCWCGGGANTYHCDTQHAGQNTCYTCTNTY